MAPDAANAAAIAAGSSVTGPCDGGRARPTSKKFLANVDAGRERRRRADRGQEHGRALARRRGDAGRRRRRSASNSAAQRYGCRRRVAGGGGGSSMFGNSVSPVSGARAGVDVAPAGLRGSRRARSATRPCRRPRPGARRRLRAPGTTPTPRRRAASVKRSTYHDPPAGSMTSARCDSRSRIDCVLRPMRRPSSVAGRAVQVVVGQHGDGVGAGDPGGEAGHGRAQGVHPRVVARHHRRRRHGVDRRGAGGLRRADDLGDARPQDRRTARNLAIVANWSPVAARRSSIRPNASAASTPRASSARRYSTAAAIVHPSSWPSDAPASWKRVPSTVTTRSAGRSAPSRAIPRGDGVELARRARRRLPASAAAPTGSAPSEPAPAVGVEPGRRAASSSASAASGQRASGLQGDRRHVEQHAVERRRRARRRRRVGQPGDVEQDRRRAPLELADGTSGAGRGVDALAHVPAVAVAGDGRRAR